MTELRPQQVRLIELIDQAIDSGCRRMMVQAPTGFGKTRVAATLAGRTWDARKRLIFTVPALSLIDQTVEKFYAEAVHDVGVIQADHPDADPNRPIQVASVQTLMRRKIPPADLVIIDEPHRWFDFYADWLKDPEWADTPFIGLSATPWTKGLGKFFDRLIIAATTQELIDAGYLSKFRVFAPSSPDLEKVRTVAGDYHEGDLSEAMDKAQLVADAVDTWIDRAQNRPTLCFAVDRAHAKHLQIKFQEAGIAASYVDAYTPASEREIIKQEFHANVVKVVCNVGCLTTGIDWDVRCIILARPTKSEMLFVQMIGRGLRTADGKDDCLILDHSDNHIRLGFVTDIQYDELDDGKPRVKPTKSRETLPKKCPQCAFMKPPKALECPACGFQPEPKCTIVPQAGELVEWTTPATPVGPTFEDKLQFLRELKGYCQERAAQGRPLKPQWPAANFREKFGHYPPRDIEYCAPAEPSRTTRNWIKSRQIAYAKSMARAS